MGEKRRVPGRWVTGTALGLVLVLMVGACTSSGQTELSTSTTVGSGGGGEGVPKPPPPAKIAPVLRKPGPPGDALAGVPTILGGLVLSAAPIVRVELWNGSELVEVTDYEEPETELRLGWNWVPPEPGLYGLTLRAFDSGGGVATSFPLWVRATEPNPPAEAAAGGMPGVLAAPLRVLGVTQVGADSASMLDITIDADSCMATVSLPAVQDVSGIAVYAASFGSTGFVPVGLLPSDGGETQLMLGASPVMVYAESFDSLRTSPGPPSVVYPPNPCASRGWMGDLVFENGVLANPKGADRAYLYVSYDGGELWDRVPGTDQTFVYTNPDGAFDFGGMLHQVGPGGSALFEAWGWVEGTLTPLGRGSWTRPEPPPSAGGAGNSLGLGDMAVGPYTGPLIADSDLDWFFGYKTVYDGQNVTETNEPILVRKGTICTYDPPPPTSTTTSTVPVSVVGGSATTTSTAAPGPAIAVLPDSCINAPFGNYSKIFRWKPIPGAFTHGLLQISTKPIPDGPVLSFPGLITTQKVDKPTGEFVDFEVTGLDDLIDPAPQTATVPDWEQMTFKVVEQLAGLGSDTKESTYSFILPEGLAPNPTFYFRMVPMNGTEPLIGESNEVVIDVEDTAPLSALPPLAPPPAMSLEVRMTPPHLPNGKYQRCVRVVENPFNLFGSGLNPAPSTTPKWFQDRGQPVPTANAFDKFYTSAQLTAFSYENGVKVNKGLVPGATVCAFQLDPPEKDWWDYVVDAVNFVGWVWDMYVHVWDMMKSWAADVLAYASGCVSIAQATGKSKAEAEALCSGLATAAINAALVAYGVPPTMPKFEELVELGKGEVRDVIVTYLTDKGIIDCGVLQAQCDDLAKELIDELMDQMQVAATQAATQAAMSGSQWVLYIHPGIYVIPEPAGTMSPAIFEIKITRSSTFGAPPPPASCTYTGNVFGTKAHYEWQNYFKGVWQKGPVYGNVMKSDSVKVDLSKLEPGESATAVLMLDKVAEFYPEGQNPILPKVPWHVKPQTWIFFVAHTVGAASTETKINLQLTGGPACGTTGQSFLQDNLATEVSEIPYP